MTQNVATECLTEMRGRELQVTHDHNGKPVGAKLHTDATGHTRAECSECQLVLPITRDNLRQTKRR